MPSSMRYGSSFLFFMCVLGVWYFGVYRTINAAVQKRMQQINTMHEQAQNMRIACEQKETLTAACAALQAHALLANNNDMHSNSLSRVLAILECIRATQMHLVSYTIDQSRIKKTCAMYPIHINARGTIPQLIACFAKLEELKMPISCIRCAYARADSGMYTITLDLKCALLCDQKSDQ